MNELRIINPIGIHEAIRFVASFRLMLDSKQFCYMIIDRTIGIGIDSHCVHVVFTVPSNKLLYKTSWL